MNSDLSVFIGGGKKYFDSRSDKENLLDKLSVKGFQIAFNLDDIKKVGSGKLAGLVADEHPAPYPERGEFLPESVQTAINLLKNNEKGFCLMVEGSQIDWACHTNDKEATINEMLDFDRAIKVAFDYADQDPNSFSLLPRTMRQEADRLQEVNLSTGEVEAIRYKRHTAVMVPVFAYGAGAAEICRHIREYRYFYKKV